MACLIEYYAFYRSTEIMFNVAQKNLLFEMITVQNSHKTYLTSSDFTYHKREAVTARQVQMLSTELDAT